MPDPIAAIPSAPVAAGAPSTPVPTPSPSPVPATVNDPRLPEGTKKPDTLAADIDKWFDETPAPGAAPVVVSPKVVEPKTDPLPGSVAGKLAAKAAPIVAPVKTSEAGTKSPDEVVAGIEAEMRAHKPNWKPAEGWNTLKTALKTEADRRAVVERELAEAKTKLASPAVAGVTIEEIESLKAREKAASDRLLVMDLENHPSFKAQFIEPKNAEIGRAAELLKAHNVQADIAALIQKPRAELGKAVAEVLKDVPEFDRVEIAESIRKAHAIEQGAKAALGQSRELAKSLQQQSVSRQREAFAKRWAPVSAAIGEFAQPVETPADATPEQRAADEAYNNDLKGLQAKAEAIALAPTSDEAVAESAIKAAAYDLHVQSVLPRVISEYEQVVALNRQLVTELNALRGRNPNHSIRPLVGGGGSDTTDPRQMDHASAADHFFKK